MNDGSTGTDATPIAPLRAADDPAGAIARCIDRRAGTTGHSVRGLLFCGGFHSSMAGSKATRCAHWARSRELDCLRFDYRGHGESAGDACCLGITHWLNDTLDMLALTDGPQLLIGSSMGAWLAVLAARACPERVAGVLTLAAAPDFTERLLQRLSPEVHRTITAGRTAWHHSHCGDDPWPLPAVLFDSGREHAVLSDRRPLGRPLSLVHGTHDTDVPDTLSRELLDAIGAGQDELLLLHGADHRLSDEHSLLAIERALDALLERTRPAAASLNR